MLCQCFVQRIYFGHLLRRDYVIYFTTSVLYFNELVIFVVCEMNFMEANSEISLEHKFVFS